MNRHSDARRVFLISAVTCAGAALLPAAASAQAKASKTAMKYQDHPKGKQDCKACLQFIPGKTPTAKGTCKVVAGPISPHGWCIAFAPKPA